MHLAPHPCLFCPQVGKDLGYLEQAVSHLAGAMVYLAQGRAQEAKSKLSKALKMAHSTLGNYQLLSCIMNVMAPLQYDAQDVSGACS